MNTAIYDKTDKGREEIATRKFRLPPRLRALLLLVDGRRPEEELLRNVAGLGLNADALLRLIEQQYIALSASHGVLEDAPGSARPPAPAPRPTPTPASNAFRDRAPSPAPTLTPELRQQKFHQLYEFYTKTIRALIGLRGLPLQLRVEKAATLEELLELRRPYLEGVLNSKGMDTALAQAKVIDELIERA